MSLKVSNELVRMTRNINSLIKGFIYNLQIDEETSAFSLLRKPSIRLYYQEP